MPKVDGGSLWELVERRAEATPDGCAAVDEDGRTLTWAESLDRGRAGGGGAGPPGHRRRRRRVVAAADVAGVEDRSCWRWPGWAPSRTRCCRSTASARSASSPARRRPSCSSSPRPGAASTSRPWRGASPTTSPPTAGHGGPRRRQGAPAGRSRRPASAARTRRRHRPLVLLHVGHDGRPEGRPAHRPHDQGERGRACASGWRSPTTTSTPSCSRSPTSAGSGGSSAPWSYGFPTVYIERFDPAEDHRR